MTIRRWQRTLACALLGAGLLAAVASCGAASGRSGAERKGTVADPRVTLGRRNLPKVAPHETPRSGDRSWCRLHRTPVAQPIVDSDWWGSSLPITSTNRCRHRSLRRPGLRFVPSSRALEISPTAPSFTFHLRHGLGCTTASLSPRRDVIGPSTRSRIAKAKTMHLKPTRKSSRANRAIDDYTVYFKWKRPYFLAMETPLASASSPRTSSSNSAPPTTTRPRPIPIIAPDRHRTGSVLASGRAREDRLCATMLLGRRRTSTGWSSASSRTPGRARARRAGRTRRGQRRTGGEMDPDAEPSLRSNFWRSRILTQLRLIGWNLRRPLFRTRRVRRVSPVVDGPA